MLQRWKMSHNNSMVTEPDGEWVEYKDHLAAIAEKDNEIARLRNSHEMKFVRHIEAHLSAYQVPICKICGKDIFEISEEDSDASIPEVKKTTATMMAAQMTMKE